MLRFFLTTLNAVEALVVLGALLLAAGFPARLRGGLAWLGPFLGRLARRPWLVVLAVALMALGFRLAALPVRPAPPPQVEDAFVNLLIADTLREGRVANPTPPLWRHFETPYVIFEPTYVGKYPLGQPFFLLVGLWLWDHPWPGLLLSAVLMAGGIAWALLGFLPPGWAFLGGALAVARIGVFSYWVNDYWGGTVTALGGALVLGALPRLRRAPGLWGGAALGLGLGLLVHSRPFEGLVYALPALGYLAWLLWRERGPARRLAALVPAALLVALALGFLAYYNWRTTGDPLLMPYQVWIEKYQLGGNFLWEAPRPAIPPTHPDLLRLAQWDTRTFAGPGDYLGELGRRLAIILSFFLGPALLPALGFAPRALGDRRPRPAWLVLAAALLASALTTHFYSHYLAAATAPLYLLVVQGMRHLAAAGRRHPRWRSLAAALALAALAMVPLGGAGRALDNLRAAGGPPPWYQQRARILAELTASGQRHLVIVRQAPDHDPAREWVYNRADLPAAQVIWARDLGPAANRELVAHYPGRRTWLLAVDATPLRLVPWPDFPAFR